MTLQLRSAANVYSISRSPLKLAIYPVNHRSVRLTDVDFTFSISSPDVFLHFVTVLPVFRKITANCEQVKSLCLEESLMSDTQVFVALAVALIPGLLALRLSTELYK
jgi:photosystem I subunit XII